MQSLADESVDMIFADPPNNIKKADWDSFENHEEFIKLSMLWINESARILKPVGTIYIDYKTITH
jgi:site-specific DNA-methyltransferase (adenine-specific)